MRRREFITLLGGAAVSWPLAARAQQSERVRRIGVLRGDAETGPEGQSENSAFRQGLQRLGWTGGNVRLLYRWGNGDVDRIRTFARELIAFQPDGVLAVSTPVVRALVAETLTVPIVFVRVADPVGDGLVDNAAKPGGNVTGFSVLQASIAGKWLQLLKEIAPGVTRVAVMFNPATAPHRGGLDFFHVAEAAAQSIGVKVNAAPVHDVAEIERVIAGVAGDANGGLISAPDIFQVIHREMIVDLTVRYHVPAIYQYRYFTAIGGLISYGTEPLDQFTRAAEYFDRILKGTKVTDLPVQAPTKYELVINLKTAKALGLDVPLHLQQRADEVIE
jgi:putative tryptophan/tyrosine transport system substrate-binding protein